MQHLRLFVTAAAVAVASLVSVSSAAAQGKEPSVSEAWVKVPPAGQSEAVAFATVENPTMYDFYLVSATADAAGKVEFREGGTAQAKSVKEVTVPAYGSLAMDDKGVHVVLTDLKKPLKEGDKVSLVLTTELGIALRIDATVKN